MPTEYSRATLLDPPPSQRRFSGSMRSSWGVSDIMGRVRAAQRLVSHAHRRVRRNSQPHTESQWSRPIESTAHCRATSDTRATRSRRTAWNLPAPAPQQRRVRFSEDEPERYSPPPAIVAWHHSGGYNGKSWWRPSDPDSDPEEYDEGAAIRFARQLIPRRPGATTDFSKTHIIKPPAHKRQNTPHRSHYPAAFVPLLPTQP